MNFTKQYIKECDCKEIQGLRKCKDQFGKWKTKIGKGDWNFTKPDHVCCDGSSVTWYYTPELTIWLPRSDQLDDEIVKICKGYTVHYGIPTIACVLYSKVRPFVNDNPLIAKIKLLKALLEEV